MTGVRQGDPHGKGASPRQERYSDAAAPRRARPRRRGLIWLLVVGLALVIVATTVAVVVGRSGNDSPVAGTPPAGPTRPAASPGQTSTPLPGGPNDAAQALTTIDPNRANCAAKPSACGLPDATNTGVPAGTTLTIVNGDLDVTRAGTVIDGKDIRGCVTVKAPAVTIRRSKITCKDFYAVANFTSYYSSGGLVIEDSEVDCANTSGTGVGDYGVTARRLNIHNCENGFDIDNTFTVQDSYIHDLYEGPEGHADGIQLAGGAHITITHNTIFNPNGTSAIISNPRSNSDVLVANNLMAGGSYTLYCPGDTSQNFRVIGNRFSTLYSAKGGEFAPWTDCEKVAEVRGNIWDDSLQPVQ